MLDWTKISDHYTFQRLVNHLFALECNSPGVIPSSPYIGADGGLDLYYQGYYPYENASGIYSIQSKWTTKSFSKAVEYFKSKKNGIPQELQKVKKSGIEHLRIATNAKLRPKQVLELEELNKGEVKTLQVWDRERLTLRIEKQPFLDHFFFGNPQYPVFVPWNVYFDKVEPYLTSFSSTEFPQFRNLIHHIKRFLLTDKKRLLILHAPGGYGKSHLLKEIAKDVAHQTDPTRQPWLLRLGFRSVEDAIQDELVTHRKYLLIFDDADRELVTVKTLLAFLKSGDLDVKIILALRSSGMYLLEQKISEWRCHEYAEQMAIRDWTQDELVTLLRMTSGTDAIKDEKKIAVFYPIPYWIVWISHNLQGKTVKDLSVIKKEFTNALIRDTQKCLTGMKEIEDIENFLLSLACIVPIHLEDGNLLGVKQAIQKMLDAGILRRIGSTIRFNPDMNGDLYLLYKLKDFDRSSLKKLVLDRMAIYPENLFTNLGVASSYSENGEANVVQNILTEFLREWLDSAEKTPGSIRSRILKLIEKIVFLVPEECTSLILTYLEVPSSKEIDPWHYAFGLGRVTLSMSDYRSVIYELVRISSSRKEVIEIIEKISDVGILNQYEQDEPQSLIRLCVSPGKNNAATVLLTLDILAKWLNDLTPKRVDSLKAALSEVLAGTYESTNYFSGKFTFGEEPLPNSPDLLKIRDKALSILKGMLSHNSLSAQLAAIDVADDIGRIRGRTSGKLPFGERFAEERREIVDAICQVTHFDADFELLSKIEDLFLVWWAAETSGTEKVVNFLRELPRSPEYIVFKWTSPSSRSVVKNFSEIETKIPTDRDERWKWFIHEVENKPWKLEDFSEIAEELNRKYVTTLEIIQFFTSLHEKTSSSRSRNTRFLTQWVKINSEMFKKIRENEQMWGQIPERFHGEIDVALAGIEQEHIQKISEEVLQAFPEASLDQVDDLLFLAGKYLSKQSWKDLITELIERGNSEVRTRILDSLISARIIHSFDKIQDIEVITFFLEHILTKENQLIHPLITGIVGVLNGYIEDNTKVCQINLKEGTLHRRLLELLQDYPSLSWQDQDLAYKLLEWCIKDIDEMIDFIEYRLNKSKEIKKSRPPLEEKFEAIPSEGIDCLESIITSFEDYLKLIRKVIIWYKSDRYWKDFETKYLIKPIALQKDTTTNELYLAKSIQTLFQEGLTDEAFICAEFLPLYQDTTDVFVELLERVISQNYESVKFLLQKKATAGWVDSCHFGEAPPVLITRKNAFETMLEKTSDARLKNLLKECIIIVARDIDGLLKEDEGRLHPR